MNLIDYLKDVKISCDRNEKPRLKYLCGVHGVGKMIPTILVKKGYLKRLSYGRYEWISKEQIDGKMALNVYESLRQYEIELRYKRLKKLIIRLHAEKYIK